MANRGKGGPNVPLWATLMVLAGIGILVVVSIHHATEKKKAAVAPRPWTFAQTTDGATLSAEAVDSTFSTDGKSTFSPTLRIVCRHGRLNVELDPLYAATCGGDCAVHSKVGMVEDFAITDDRNAHLAEAMTKTPTSGAPLEQDLLSNAPGDILVSGDKRLGVAQSGDWLKDSSTLAASRFDYGETDAKADYVAKVDMQARNYINRLAASNWFTLGQNGLAARYSTRLLGAQLPKLWAVCPAPKAN